MSIKIALLKSGESVIADIKELISDEKICGYLFKNPYIVDLAPNEEVLLLEEGQTPPEDRNVGEFWFSIKFVDRHLKDIQQTR